VNAARHLATALLLEDAGWFFGFFVGTSVWMPTARDRVPAAGISSLLERR